MMNLTLEWVTMAPKVLVTGGAGFIGKHLCSYLHRLGYNVTSLDITQPIGNWNCIEADIRDEIDLTGIESVVHLAAKISVQESLLKPEETNSVNIEGTESILRQSEEAGVKRFIFASSAAVYGDQGAKPINEKSPLSPLSPYAESKIAGEELCKSSQLQTCSMRFFNVYGSNQPIQGGYAAVIPAFKKAIDEGRNVVVYGDGNQVRDFIHVNDLVDLIEQSLRMENLPESVNIATGESTSILELVNLFKSKYTLNGVDFLPDREGDIKSSIADVSLMREVFQTERIRKLSEGLT